MMTRDHIRSKALFKSEVLTGKQESVERGGTEVPWPSSCDTNLESLELVSGGESAGLARVRASWLCLFDADLESSDMESGGESRLLMIGGTWTDSEFVVDTITSGSSIMRFAAASPVGSKLSESALCELSRGIPFPPYSTDSFLPRQTLPLSKALDLMRSLVIT